MNQRYRRSQKKSNQQQKPKTSAIFKWKQLKLATLTPTVFKSGSMSLEYEKLNKLEEQLNAQEIDEKQLKHYLPPQDDSIQTESILSLSTKIRQSVNQIRGFRFYTDPPKSNSQSVPTSLNTQQSYQAIGQKFKLSTVLKTIDAQKQNEDQWWYLPQWFREDKNFQKFYFQQKNFQKLELPKICCKDHAERNILEVKKIQQYLFSIQLFEEFSESLVYNLARRAKTETLQEGKILREFHTEIYQLCIVYSGSVKATNIMNQVEIFEEKSVIFREEMIRNIQHSQREYACKKDCILLNISFFNFYTDLDQSYITQSKEYMSQLFQNGFFNQFTTIQIEKFKSAAKLIIWAKNEIPIRMEDQIKHLFVILSGQLKVKTIHTMNFTNKWPKGLRQWEIKHVMKSIYYESQLNQFEFFGDHELLNTKVSDYEIRVNKVTLMLALQDSDFQDIFSKNDQSKFYHFRKQRIQEQNQLINQRHQERKRLLSIDLIRQLKNKQSPRGRSVSMFPKLTK